MATITADDNVLKALQAFVDDKIESPMALLNSFSEEEFKFSIKFKKYNASLNASSAAVIINFQDAVYRIAALCIHGVSDVRKLTEEEKQEFEIPFKISEGSTEEETAYLLAKTKLIVAKTRYFTVGTYVTVAMAIVASIQVAYHIYDNERDRFSENEIVVSSQRKLQLEETELEIEDVEIKSEEESNQELKKKDIELCEKAIIKLSQEEESQKFVDIIDDYYSKQSKTLSEIDNEVEVNGTIFNKFQLQKIHEEYEKKKKKNKIKEHGEKAGMYYINQINFKDRKIFIENAETGEKAKIVYDYNEANLFNRSGEIEEILHLAMRDSRQSFFIKYDALYDGDKIKGKLLFIRKNEE